MLDATLATMGWVVSNYLNADVEPQPMGNDNFTAAPSGTFRTADGLLDIAANEQKQFEALSYFLGAPEWKTGARFAEREARKRHRGELNAALEARLATQSAAAWEAQLIAAGVPAGRVLTVPAILHHEHTQAAATIASFADVPGVPPPVQVGRPGFRYDGTRPQGGGPRRVARHRCGSLNGTCA